MNITYLISPGFFPTCLREIGSWYDDLVEKNEVEVYQANYKLWEYIFSPDIGELYPKEIKARIENHGRETAEVLKSFRCREIYENLDAYRNSISKLLSYFELLNSAQNECGFYFPYGVFVKKLNYKKSQVFLEYCAENSMLHKLIEKSLIDINRNTDVLFIKVSSNEELLNSMICVNILKKNNPNIYCCLVDHSFENFSLSNILDDDSNLLKVFDSIIKYKDEKDFIIPALVDDISKGNKKLGILTAESFDNISVNNNKISSMPVIDAFNVENMITMRISYNKCYWSKCTFCVQNVKYRHNTNEIINVEGAVNKIERFIKDGYTQFSFSDEALSPYFLKSFCREIIKRGLNLKWGCRCRFEKAFNDELLKLMKTAGCYEILFGLEAVSEKVLKSMRKYEDIPTVNDIKEIVYNTHKNGIVPHLTTIVGYPTETVQDSIDTVEFIKEIVRTIPEAVCVINKFALFPKSTIAENSNKFNIDVKANDEDIPYDLKFNYISGPYSEKDYLDKLILKLNKELYEATYWHKFGSDYSTKVVKLMYSSTGHGAIFKNNLKAVFKYR